MRHSQFFNMLKIALRIAAFDCRIFFIAFIYDLYYRYFPQSAFGVNNFFIKFLREIGGHNFLYVGFQRHNFPFVIILWRQNNLRIPGISTVNPVGSRRKLRGICQG